MNMLDWYLTCYQHVAKIFLRGDNDLQKLDFWQFIEALRKSDLKSDRNLILLGGKQNLNPTKKEKYKRNI